MKPQYYKALWHNCTKCRIHYMSEQPNLKAYLCDECWNSMPHYRTKNVVKAQQKPMRGPTYDLRSRDLIGALLYLLGCSICLAIIAYYLWWK